MSLRATMQLSDADCSSWWSLLNPYAWSGGCIVHDVKYATGSTDSLSTAQLRQNPYMQPPAAPQTEDKMRVWTAADEAEALAQRYGQYSTDIGVTRENTQDSRSSWAATWEGLPSTEKYLWIMVAVIAVLWFLKR